jgi:hypothetical protein
MMKHFIMVAVILMIGLSAGAEVMQLPDLTNPQRIRTDENHIYIVEGPHIYIHSATTRKLIRKIGKQGLGPKEFNVHPGTPLTINVQGKNMMVKSRRRMYYFSKDGDYLNEFKGAGLAVGAQPLDKGYAGISYTREKNIRYMAINIYDETLNIQKQLYKTPDEIKTGKGLYFLSIPQAYTTSFCTYKNRIYIALDRELHIRVYDREGNQINTIKKDYQPLKLSKEYKQKVVNHYTTDKFLKQYYHQVFSPITFPDSFPAVRDLRVTDGKIYAITYKKQKDLTECFIFDTEGKFLQQVWLLLEETNILNHYPFDIKNGKLYQLVENEDEVWELHISEIK